MSIFRQIARLQEPPELARLLAVSEPQPPADWSRVRGLWDSGRYAPPPADLRPMTRDELQDYVRGEIDAYLADPHPDEMLLIVTPPGSGKTYIMADVAREMAEKGWRVAYHGPRTDFYDSLVNEAEKQGQLPGDWYQWQPRSADNCLYHGAVAEWVSRGHRAIDFCSQICGWDYIGGECAYHAQRDIDNALVYGTHPHTFLGNPLMSRGVFDLVIGDESPVQSATLLHRWRIPARSVAPFAMDSSNPLFAVISRLQILAHEQRGSLTGPALLDALGGPQEVLRSTEAWLASVDLDRIEAPSIQPVENLPGEIDYAHLPDLCKLLRREATLALDGDPYIHRVAVHSGALWLSLRRYPHPELPAHVIWLDATGSQEIYEAAFGRPVRVVRATLQRRGRLIYVANRSNNKTALLDGKRRTEKLNDARRTVEVLVRKHGYDCVAVLTFKDAKYEFEIVTDNLMHFGGQRGSNALVEDFERALDEGKKCALFVVGTPTPPLTEILLSASMLWFNEDRPFDHEWEDRLVPVPNSPYWYYRSGYWSDPRLMALLEQMREAELIQALTRSRLFTLPVDTWALTNLPLEALYPDEVTTLEEIFDPPEGASPTRWAYALLAAEEYCAAYGIVTAADLALEMDVTPETGRRYVDHLIDRGWVAALRLSKRAVGRRSNGATKAPPTPPPLQYDGGTWAQLCHMRDALIARGEFTVNGVRVELGCSRAEAREHYQALKEAMDAVDS